jgi:hypothetical protein
MNSVLVRSAAVVGINTNITAVQKLSIVLKFIFLKNFYLNLKGLYISQ